MTVHIDSLGAGLVKGLKDADAKEREHGCWSFLDGSLHGALDRIRDRVVLKMTLARVTIRKIPEFGWDVTMHREGCSCLTKEQVHST